MVGRDGGSVRDDAGLFDRFVARDSPELLRLAWGLTGDRGRAEDLVQTALERVWLRWAQVADREHPEGYARRVVVSIFLTSRRRRWSSEVLAHDGLDQVMGDHADSTVVRYAVIAALVRLPAKQRAAVVLRYLDDRSEMETAHALGCSVGTVKSHTARALRTLRSCPGVAGVWTAPGNDRTELTS